MERIPKLIKFPVDLVVRIEEYLEKRIILKVFQELFTN